MARKNDNVHRTALDIHNRQQPERRRRPPERFELKYLEFVPLYGAYLPRAPAFRTVSAAEAQRISSRLSRPTVMSNLRQQSAFERVITRSSISARENSRSSLRSKSGRSRGGSEATEGEGSTPRRDQVSAKSKSQAYSEKIISKTDKKTEICHKVHINGDVTKQNKTLNVSDPMPNSSNTIIYNKDKINNNENLNNNHVENDVPITKSIENSSSVANFSVDRRDKSFNSDDSSINADLPPAYEDKLSTRGSPERGSRQKRLKHRSKENRISLLEQIMNLHPKEVKESAKKPTSEAKLSRRLSRQCIHTRLGHSPYLEPMLQWYVIVACSRKNCSPRKKISGKHCRDSDKNIKVRSKEQGKKSTESHDKRDKLPVSGGCFASGEYAGSDLRESKSGVDDESSDEEKSTDFSPRSINKRDVEKSATISGGDPKNRNSRFRKEDKIVKIERPHTAPESINVIKPNVRAARNETNTLPSLTQYKHQTSYSFLKAPRSTRNRQTLSNNNYQSKRSWKEQNMSKARHSHIQTINYNSRHLKQADRRSDDHSTLKPRLSGVIKIQRRPKSDVAGELLDVDQGVNKAARSPSKEKKERKQVAINKYEQKYKNQNDGINKKDIYKTPVSCEGQDVGVSSSSSRDHQEENEADVVSQRDSQETTKYSPSSSSSLSSYLPAKSESSGGESSSSSTSRVSSSLSTSSSDDTLSQTRSLSRSSLELKGQSSNTSSAQSESSVSQKNRSSSVVDNAEIDLNAADNIVDDCTDLLQETKTRSPSGSQRSNSLEKAVSSPVESVKISQHDDKNTEIFSRNQTLYQNINENVDHIVDQNFDKKINENVSHNFDKDVNQDVNQNVTHNVNLSVVLKVDQSIDQNVDQNFDQNVNQNIDLKVDNLIDQSFEENTDQNISKDVRLNVDQKMVHQSASQRVDQGVSQRVDQGVTQSFDENIDQNINRNVDQNFDQNVNHNVNQNIDQNIDHNVNQNIDQNIDHNGNQNIDQNIDHNVNQNIDQNIDHNVNQNIDQNIDHNVNQNVDQNIDHNVNQNFDQNAGHNIDLAVV